MTDERKVRVRDPIGLGAGLMIGVLGGMFIARMAVQAYDQYAPVDWPRIERDATDSETDRSNLGLRIDHGTGCQYLVTSLGGITPRLGSDGRHVCEPNTIMDE